MARMRQAYRLEELSWPAAQAAFEAGAMAVLPVGSLEQHGRHLAINTDNVLGDALAESAVRAAAARGVNLLLCPSLHYGYTMHNMDFPGTMTLRTETLLAVGVDLVTSLVHHGCKKIVLLNSHGSNWSILDLVGREVMNRHPEVLVAAIFPIKMAAAELEALREAKQTGGMSHGCELETSLMLHLRPELVEMDKAVVDISQPDSKFYWRDILRGSRGVALADLTRHASRTGLVGDPTVATAEKGGRFFAVIAAATVEFLQEFAQRQVQVALDVPLRHERTAIE
ncbi:MAG: creatininase family protein [Candidatus Methylomirabilota bacterium]